MGDKFMHEFSNVQNGLEFFVEVAFWNRTSLINRILEDAVVKWD